MQSEDLKLTNADLYKCSLVTYGCRCKNDF